MKTVDAVADEIRFTTEWGGLIRYVFIPDPFVSEDVGHRVTRDEAISYVRENLERYRSEARAQHGDDSREKIVILARPSGEGGRSRLED
ncbi:hypothetical protein EON81_25665 [bacterium]|nr:MAG: hypothetical protein EON81_25665 [bacterium]